MKEITTNQRQKIIAFIEDIERNINQDKESIEALAANKKWDQISTVSLRMHSNSYLLDRAQLGFQLLMKDRYGGCGWPIEEVIDSLSKNIELAQHGFEYNDPWDVIHSVHRIQANQRMIEFLQSLTGDNHENQ